MHAKAAADAGLLRQYLGYAVAFDAVDRWVDAFAAPDLTWMGATDVSLLSGWVYGSTMRQASTPPAPVSTRLELELRWVQRRRRWRRLRWWLRRRRRRQLVSRRLRGSPGQA